MSKLDTQSSISESDEIRYSAHGCDVTVKDGKITVREGDDEITATLESEEWSIQTYILGQIHGILNEYTPKELYDAVILSQKTFNKE